jgi:excisionase family DNA binding protein
MRVPTKKVRRMRAPATALMINPLEAAELIGVGKNRIYRAIRENQIPHVKIGAQYKIPRRLVMEMIERGSFADLGK